VFKIQQMNVRVRHQLLVAGIFYLVSLTPVLGFELAPTTVLSNGDISLSLHIDNLIGSNIMEMNSNQSSSQALEITMNGCLNITDCYLGKGLGISHPLKRIDFFKSSENTVHDLNHFVTLKYLIHNDLNTINYKYFVSSYNYKLDVLHPFKNGDRK
tara:strand:+ start:7962 stop:8429 length:468 start_codon:yes stop_codon:yes gene_type:complete